jgi:putative oxidoreductase
MFNRHILLIALDISISRKGGVKEMDEGLLIIRLVLGLILAAHGAQKLFGIFGGHGIKGTGQWLESIGIKPGAFFAFLTGLGEFGGGLLIAAGVYTKVCAILIIFIMLVAIFTVHWKNGLWNGANGYEYNLLIIAVSIGLYLTGPGTHTLF